MRRNIKRKPQISGRVRVLRFYKPYGVLPQFTDDAGRPTLADFGLPKGIYPAGRLDFDSEGLMILTNDGSVQYSISDPKQKLYKTYWVQVEGDPRDEDLHPIRAGIQLKDGLTLPAFARVMDAPDLPPRVPPIRVRKSIPDSWIEIRLQEGKNRQVRRMTAAIGFPTLRLFRAEIGGVCLDGLSPGEFDEIDDWESQIFADDASR